MLKKLLTIRGIARTLIFVSLTCWLSVIALGHSPLKKTDHGYKGRYLEATRQKPTEDAPFKVLSLRIDEIEFRGLIDRVELAEIIEKNGGCIWSGGFQGIEMITFKGMDTRAKQDSVIKVLLPKLERWYAQQ